MENSTHQSTQAEFLHCLLNNGHFIYANSLFICNSENAYVQNVGSKQKLYYRMSPVTLNNHIEMKIEWHDRSTFNLALVSIVKNTSK